LSRAFAVTIIAYGGYGELYREGRAPGPVSEAGCFAHARRKFFELADVEGAARNMSRGERTGMIYPIALGDYPLFCARGRLSSSDDEPLAEDHGELALGLTPLARRPFPFVRCVIEQ